MFVLYNTHVSTRDLEGMPKVQDELEAFFNVSWTGLVILEWSASSEPGVADDTHAGHWACRTQQNWVALVEFRQEQGSLLQK